jgi:hypothetical protein
MTRELTISDIVTENIEWLEGIVKGLEVEGDLETGLQAVQQGRLVHYDTGTGLIKPRRVRSKEQTSVIVTRFCDYQLFPELGTMTREEYRDGDWHPREKGRFATELGDSIFLRSICAYNMQLQLSTRKRYTK